MVSGNFAEMTPFLRHLGIFYMPKIYDMGPTASAGFEPEASMLTTRPPKPLDTPLTRSN
jgi:hypothetical protein